MPYLSMYDVVLRTRGFVKINVGAGSQAQGPDKENVTLVTQLKLIHFGRKKIQEKMFKKCFCVENFAWNRCHIGAHLAKACDFRIFCCKKRNIFAQVPWHFLRGRVCVKDVTLLKLIVTPKIRNVIVTCACDPAPTLIKMTFQSVLILHREKRGRHGFVASNLNFSTPKKRMPYGQYKSR